MRFEIDENIFEHFPGLQVVAAVAKDIEPLADTGQIQGALEAAWHSAGKAATEYKNPQSHPFIKPWGERMKAIGAPRKHFPSSIEALVRRAGKTDVPVSINPLVDFYNAISLKHLAPAGGYDIAALQTDFQLRFSGPGDTFQALDSDEQLSVPEGEVSYADGNIIITRHFVWKQSKHAILTPATSQVLFVSEILGDLPADMADKVAADFASGLEQFFGVSATVAILQADHSSLEL